jgi:hypothetical protein
MRYLDISRWLIENKPVRFLAGDRPPRAWIRAHIEVSGCTIRPTGRRRIEASPST